MNGALTATTETSTGPPRSCNKKRIWVRVGHDRCEVAAYTASLCSYTPAASPPPMQPAAAPTFLCGGLLILVVRTPSARDAAASTQCGGASDPAAL